MYTIPPENTGREHHAESIAPERKKNMKRFGLNVEDKKTLVKRVGEFTGQQPHYTYVPRCAYEIGAYTVERNGDLVVEDRELDETLIQTLLSEGLISSGKDGVQQNTHDGGYCQSGKVYAHGSDHEAYCSCFREVDSKSKTNDESCNDDIS